MASGPRVEEPDVRVAFLLQPRDLFAWGRMSSVTLVTWLVARQLATRGRTVSIYARRGSDQPPRETVENGVEVFRIDGGPRWRESVREGVSGLLPGTIPRTLQAGYYGDFVDRTIRALREASPDVVYLSTQVQYVPRIRAALPDALIVMHLLDELVAHLPAEWVRGQLREADRIVCLRDQLHDRLRGLCPDLEPRMRTIRAGVDPERFTPPGPGARADAGQMLFVGRLSPEKGLHVLAEAFAELHRRRPEARLKIVGPSGMMPFAWIRGVAAHDAHVATLAPFYGRTLLGRLYREGWQRGAGYVEEVKRRLGASLPAVDFVPHVGHDELPALYRGASVLLAPSVCLELPIPVYEGMACGLVPVLSYESPGEDVVRWDETAVQVPRNDPRGLTEALDDLLGDPVRVHSMGDAARRAVAAEAGWGRRAEQLDALLSEAVGG